MIIMAKLNKPVGDTSRPIRVTIDATFANDGARKIHGPDLKRASEAAAMAFRASLEARTPAYKMAEVSYDMYYSYRVSRSNGTV